MRCILKHIDVITIETSLKYSTKQHLGSFLISMPAAQSINQQLLSKCKSLRLCMVLEASLGPAVLSSLLSPGNSYVKRPCFYKAKGAVMTPNITHQDAPYPAKLYYSFGFSGNGRLQVIRGGPVTPLAVVLHSVWNRDGSILLGKCRGKYKGMETCSFNWDIFMINVFLAFSCRKNSIIIKMFWSLVQSVFCPLRRYRLNCHLAMCVWLSPAFSVIHRRELRVGEDTMVVWFEWRLIKHLERRYTAVCLSL